MYYSHHFGFFDTKNSCKLCSATICSKDLYDLPLPPPITSSLSACRRCASHVFRHMRMKRLNEQRAKAQQEPLFVLHEHLRRSRQMILALLPNFQGLVLSLKSYEESNRYRSTKVQLDSQGPILDMMESTMITQRQLSKAFTNIERYLKKIFNPSIEAPMRNRLIQGMRHAIIDFVSHHLPEFRLSCERLEQFQKNSNILGGGASYKSSSSSSDRLNSTLRASSIELPSNTISNGTLSKCTHLDDITVGHSSSSYLQPNHTHWPQNRSSPQLCSSESPTTLDLSCPSSQDNQSNSLILKSSSVPYMSNQIRPSLVDNITPCIYSISPTTCPTTGGFLVSIEGSNFQPTSQILVNGIAIMPKHVLFNSEDRLSFITPVIEQEGTATLEISNGSHKSILLEQVLSFCDYPALMDGLCNTNQITK